MRTFNRFGNWICKFCNIQFDFLPKYANHMANHSEKKKQNWKPWNKNKNKMNDERIAKYAKAISVSLKNHIPWNKGKTKHNDLRMLKMSKKMQITVSDRIKNNKWHSYFGNSRNYQYDGENFNGTWELAYAKHLNENNISWLRPKQGFKYLFNGDEHLYFPDFYIVEKDLYVEIKGYKTERDEAKWSQFPFKLQVLKYSDLKHILVS